MSTPSTLFEAITAHMCVVLEYTGWKVRETARVLGVTPRTLQRMLDARPALKAERLEKGPSERERRP